MAALIFLKKLKMTSSSKVIVALLCFLIGINEVGKGIGQI